MPQSEIVPTDWRTVSEEQRAGRHENLLLETEVNDLKVEFTFEQIAEDVYRTTFNSQEHPLPPWPSISYSATRPLGSSTQPGSVVSASIYSTDSPFAAVEVNWTTGPPLVSVKLKHEPHTVIHNDLPHRSYVLDGPGIAHYTSYNREALHVGLGEKCAPFDLSGRHFILSATDCFGYDVHRSDPLYKHIPLLMTATSGYTVATFSTSHSRGTYSVSSEIDGMWGRYKVYRQDHGGLEEYILIGKTMQDVLCKYADLVGYPLLVPRWAFGYLAGGMKYSMLDEPRAHDALMGFADRLRSEDIPCSGFQLSSGYTVAETEPKTRNVFTWNRHRFPDPKAFVDAFLGGIRIIANVKPYVLANHPAYERLRDKGAFFRDPLTQKSAQARLWSAGGGESGVGGHIDFASRAGYDFWVDGVKELRRLGIACIWNDNNEYVILDDKWQSALDPDIVPTARAAGPLRKDIGLWGRYMHTELMAKASHNAVLEIRSTERPFILTRSATAGTMRYAASTWSGDNVTSWSSMRGANALSLTASTSLLHCYGHDIGGFEGPQPSPELLLRWVQLGCHSMRFAINCFKTSPEDNSVGDVIEPWMYPSITDLVRKAIKRRYEMIPYLYSLMLRSHLWAEPPVRWTGWAHSSDREVWESQVLRDGETQYFLGDVLLVGGVYEPGVETAKVYLPSSTPTIAGKDDREEREYFFNLNPPYNYLRAGQWHIIPSPWKESIPLLAKAGTLLPVGRPVQTSTPASDLDSASLPADDYRAVELFPPPVTAPAHRNCYTNFWLEDDGISPAPSAILKVEIEYVCDAEAVDIVTYTHTTLRQDAEGKGYKPLWRALHFIVPVGDGRIVRLHGEQMQQGAGDENGRAVYVASVDDLLAMQSTRQK